MLLCAGIIAAISGILPWPATVELIDRVLPILVFVVAITVVSELAAAAGLFTFVAERLTVWAGGRTWLLWLLVVALAVLSTVFLSLDTTAVLLTPRGRLPAPAARGLHRGRDHPGGASGSARHQRDHRRRPPSRPWLSGLPVWIPAVLAALILVAVFAARY